MSPSPTSKLNRPVGPNVLLTGATGYVGGRLLSRLEKSGFRVRCLARRPDFLASRVGAETDIVQGDVLSAETLPAAFEGIDTAYYMIHSMGNASAEGFEKEDRNGARNFAHAAAAAGVKRIIYLGGLGSERDSLSPHLSSRHEVGRILREPGIPVIEFRASVIIGSGSLSFEMLRSLVEKLPVMVTPKWVHVRAQPIGIEDVLDYLEQALRLNVEGSQVYEIGGSEQLSYGELMRLYASIRGLRRTMIPVPVLSPRLSSLWLGLVTPLYARVGRDLIESICHETVVSDPQARLDFDITPIGTRDALERALRNEDMEFAQTRWSDAISSGGTDPYLFGRPSAVRLGRRLADSREVEVAASPENAFAPIRRIGGDVGWYAFNWLWQLRGVLDLIVGGVGLRRGRKDPDSMQEGDAVDWWRVDTYQPNEFLRMHAEMKVPGRAWLEFEVRPTPNGAVIRQTAVFDPSGLSGLAYWYGVYPLHAVVFRGMLAGIARAAESQASSTRDGD
jgi:uncharacterized protein YbjT (DUF2867 family)